MDSNMETSSTAPRLQTSPSTGLFALFYDFPISSTVLERLYPAAESMDTADETTRRSGASAPAANPRRAPSTPSSIPCLDLTAVWTCADEPILSTNTAPGICIIFSRCAATPFRHPCLMLAFDTRPARPPPPRPASGAPPRPAPQEGALGARNHRASKVNRPPPRIADSTPPLAAPAVAIVVGGEGGKGGGGFAHGE